MRFFACASCRVHCLFFVGRVPVFRKRVPPTLNNTIMYYSHLPQNLFFLVRNRFVLIIIVRPHDEDGPAAAGDDEDDDDWRKRNEEENAISVVALFRPRHV